MIPSKYASPIQNLIDSSWSKSTKAGYSGSFKKWVKFCAENGVSDPQNAGYEIGLSFLAKLFYDDRASYGTIATARSMLSNVLPTQDGKSFGKYKDVTQLLKGVFKLRPQFPRYTEMYDPSVVLNYICSLPRNEELTLECLVKKLATMLCLLSGQRGQTVGALRLDAMSRSPEKYTFLSETF